MVAGVVISAAIYWFACTCMNYKRASSHKPIRLLFLAIQYALIILWETAKANIIVFKVVFSRTIKVEPRIVYFRTNLKSSALRVTLASSINLTPGTISISLDDDLFCVHCLNGEVAEGIEDSLFVRHLKKIENLKKIE